MKVTYKRTTTITIDLPLGVPAFHKADAEAWANRAHGRTTRLQAQVNATLAAHAGIVDGVLAQHCRHGPPAPLTGGK